MKARATSALELTHWSQEELQQEEEETKSLHKMVGPKRQDADAAVNSSEKANYERSAKPPLPAGDLGVRYNSKLLTCVVCDSNP